MDISLHCLLALLLSLLRIVPSTGRIAGLDMKNFKSEQIGTWRERGSNLAVDGDLETYIVACKPCYLSNGSVEIPAWWKVNLGKIYFIYEVHISKTLNEFGKFLRDYRITMTVKGGKDQICDERRDFDRLNWVIIKCKQPLFADEVMISRLKESNLRPGLLSFAEVALKVESSVPVLVVDSTLLTVALSFSIGYRFVLDLAVCLIHRLISAR